MKIAIAAYCLFAATLVFGLSLHAEHQEELKRLRRSWHSSSVAMKDKGTIHDSAVGKGS
jgi:hypothetical protein